MFVQCIFFQYTLHRNKDTHQYVSLDVWWSEEVHTGFWWFKLRERGHLEHPDLDVKVVLKCIFGT